MWSVIVEPFGISMTSEHPELLYDNNIPIWENVSSLSNQCQDGNRVYIELGKNSNED